MGLDEKKRKEFRALLKKWKDNQYKLEVPAIKNLSEHEKNVYMLLLSTVVQYSNTTTDDQLLYLKRIANGNEVPEDAETYLRKAAELTQQTIDDFVKAFKTSSGKYYFVLDALILIALGERASESGDYLAGLMDILGLKETEVTYFCKLAKAVVEQNSAGYDEAKRIVDLSELKGFNPVSYLLSFYAGVIIDTDEEFYWFAPTPTEADITDFENITAKNIMIKNVIVSVTENLNFNGPNVILENSTWKDGKGTLGFYSCETVQINNCLFKDFTVRVIWEDKIGRMEITDCKFENCYQHHTDSSYGWSREGQVLGSSGGGNGIVMINESTFRNCGGRNSYRSRRSAIIYDGRCEVRNSRFISCWHYHDNTYKDYEDSHRTMFLPNTVSENNHVSDSANFC